MGEKGVQLTTPPTPASLFLSRLLTTPPFPAFLDSTLARSAPSPSPLQAPLPLPTHFNVSIPSSSFSRSFCSTLNYYPYIPKYSVRSVTPGPQSHCPSPLGHLKASVQASVSSSPTTRFQFLCLTQ